MPKKLLSSPFATLTRPISSSLEPSAPAQSAMYLGEERAGFKAQVCKYAGDKLYICKTRWTTICRNTTRAWIAGTIRLLHSHHFTRLPSPLLPTHHPTPLNIIYPLTNQKCSRPTTTTIKIHLTIPPTLQASRTNRHHLHSLLILIKNHPNNRKAQLKTQTVLFIRWACSQMRLILTDILTTPTLACLILMECILHTTTTDRWAICIQGNLAATLVVSQWTLEWCLLLHTSLPSSLTSKTTTVPSSNRKS